MTLPSSGPISIADINAEFGRGANLGAYRGTGWYTDAGASGTFPTGAISFSDFYGKRLTSPHHPFGFNNFSGSPSMSNGDLTVSGSGVALTSYAARGGGFCVDFYINSASCIVGLSGGTPSDYPGDASQLGVGLRQDGIMFSHYGTGLVTSDVQSGYGSGSIVTAYYTGFDLFFYVNGVFAASTRYGFDYTFYPCVQVAGGSVTLQTAGTYGITTYWYP